MEAWKRERRPTGSLLGDCRKNEDSAVISKCRRTCMWVGHCFIEKEAMHALTKHRIVCMRV